MKAYSDLGQSKKLAEILPLESADMFLALDGKIPVMSKYIDDGFVTADDTAIPCWSLAALMEILNGAAFTRGGTAPECYEATIFYTDEAPKLKRMTCTGTSYVDACYKMIMKLHEMNILTLPKTMEE